MLRLVCPFCGPRSEAEFACAGEATPRPDAAGPPDAAALAGRLYLRDNAMGPRSEWWWHRHGCRRWFAVVRDTRDNRILS